MSRLPDNNLYTPTSVNREINIHAKKLAVLEILERAVATFEVDMKEAFALCPFGHDSLGVQRVVNLATNWTTEYAEMVNETRNLATLEHFNALEVLGVTESEVEPTYEQQELFKKALLEEDTLATAKSNVTEQLLESREYRIKENSRAAAFEANLQELTEQYIMRDNNKVNTNSGNACHS